MNNHSRIAAEALAILVLLTLSWAASAPAADYGEGRRLFRTGKYAECVAYTNSAIRAGETNENLAVLKLRAELALGRYAEALQTLDAALARQEFSVQLRWLGREACRFGGRPERAGAMSDEIAALVKQQAWRYRDPVNIVVIGRCYLSRGADPKQVLDGLYNPAKKQQPGFIDAFLASGDLALEKHDYALAAEAFAAAVKVDADEPDAHFGLAQAFAASDAEKSQAAIEAALAVNPNHVDSLLFLVDGHIDAERYDLAQDLLQRVERVNPEHPRAWAYRAVLAHLANQPEKEAECRAAALRHWASNPEVDHLIGSKLSQKYRFAEGAAHQRQALAFDADYLPAKVQLAQDLLRLGEEAEGWQLADAVYERDDYNILAHNLVTLHDSLAKFRALEGDGLLVRMDAREAEIYGRRVVELLTRAKRTLCDKYGVTLDEPVLVELFPRQEDFAIRTFGLPGGAGFLGVCFGRVITANSPASQGEQRANWQATLWHEFCHVVTLHKTNNKMPRWLSEGISVYEERQADPTWGQSINPRYREMILGDDLVPVSKLSAAFLHPATPQHLQFAYYESSLVVEYLVEKYGLQTLQRVLTDLGVGMPINESLARYAGSIEALDREFAGFARRRANEMAPEADWSKPKVAETADAAELVAWLKDHPRSYYALAWLAKQLLAERKFAEAQKPLNEMVRLFPQNGGAGNPYALLATTYRELSDTERERTTLEKLASLSADDAASLTRLLELCTQAEDWAATERYAQRLLAVNPLTPSPHRSLALAAEHTGENALAIDACRALLLLDPIDPAEAHYRLASLLHRTGDLPGAKRHALAALEEAPRYRAAQRELLAIVEELNAGAEARETRSAETSDGTTAPAAATVPASPESAGGTPAPQSPKDARR